MGQIFLQFYIKKVDKCNRECIKENKKNFFKERMGKKEEKKM